MRLAKHRARRGHHHKKEPPPPPPKKELTHGELAAAIAVPIIVAIVAIVLGVIFGMGSSGSSVTVIPDITRVHTDMQTRLATLVATRAATHPYTGTHPATYTCSPACQNSGICTAPNVCTCPTAFVGPQCQYEAQSVAGVVFWYQLAPSNSGGNLVGAAQLDANCSQLSSLQANQFTESYVQIQNTGGIINGKAYISVQDTSSLLNRYMWNPFVANTYITYPLKAYDPAQPAGTLSWFSLPDAGTLSSVHSTGFPSSMQTYFPIMSSPNYQIWSGSVADGTWGTLPAKTCSDWTVNDSSLGYYMDSSATTYSTGALVCSTTLPTRFMYLCIAPVLYV